MLTLLCNKCFQQRVEANGTLEFYMTTCKHILCKNCLLPECPICKRKSSSHIISKDMPKSMAKYFIEPKKLFQQYRRTVQFQLEQQARANNYYVNTQPELILQLKKKQNAFIRMDQQLDSMILKEKERIKKLTKYLNHHDRRGKFATTLAGFVGATQKTTISKRSSIKSKHNSEATSTVHTPTLSNSAT